MTRGRATDRERIATILRELRLAKRLRQADIAKAIGETQSYVSRYESADQRLDLVDLKKIGSALGISLVDLVRKVESGR